MSAVSFVVPGKPCGVNATHTGGARPFVKSQEARSFAARVALMGTIARRRAKWETTSGPVEVAIRMVFANERPDTDGPVKAILDALQTATNRRQGAGFIANDRQVQRYTVERVIDRKQPRTEVTVRLAGNVEADHPLDTPAHDTRERT
jgi:Holliday junction resolvase RusA-like endonuclease